MATWDIIELSGLPRDGSVLQAKLHNHRYERRRARRRRVFGAILVVVLAGAVAMFWSQLQPLLAQLSVYELVAIAAGIVFVVSSARLVRRRRARREQYAGGLSRATS